MTSSAGDFRKFDVVIVVLSAITYLVDVATDVLVTVQYMIEGQLMWFTLTLAFIVVPMVLMQVFSLKWYLAEPNARISFLNGFLHSIGLALLKRYANVLMTWSDVKTSADPALIEKLFLQINDVFLLRLFQCFLESAPQLILHTYVAISHWSVSFSSAFSILFSLVSLSWGFATYTDILRLTYRDSYQRKWSGLLLQVGWQVGMIISRVMALVMFAVCFQGWLFLPIFIHWLLMTVWIIAEKPNFSSFWWEDKLYACVVGFIYIFCFLNIQEGRTRWRMFFFYALQLLENSLIVVTWMLADLSLQDIYQWLFTALVYIGFLVGVVCLLLFYGCYHPDKKDSDSSGEISEEPITQTVQSLRRSTKRGGVSSSSITSNTSLMKQDGKPSDYRPFPYRKEPIGCPDLSADIRFLSINDGTPTFSSGKFPAFNHGMLQDDDDVDESSAKIFSSTAVDEETPRGLKFIKRTTPNQNPLKHENLQAGGGRSMRPDSKDQKFSMFGCSNSQQVLNTKGQDRETDLPEHIGYCPKKGYVLNLTSPPPKMPQSCHEPREHHQLGRHNSENIKSTAEVSTVDDLSHKYKQFRESWDGSDRYLQMLEKYCDREDQPVKYTYLNSVYEPTTKPMERKGKVSPLSKLRSSFRQKLNAMRNLNYKEMSPALNPNQYFTGQDSFKSNPSLLQCPGLPHSETFHSGENQCGIFYNSCHLKEHVANSQKCSQPCSDQCHRQSQKYELCDHGCGRKRISYPRKCYDGQQQPGNAPYCIRNPTQSENMDTWNNPTSHYHPLPMDRCAFYNQASNSGYLTLPRKQKSVQTGPTQSSAFSQCYPTLRSPPGSHQNHHHPPSNDLNTYVVYSDKPSVGRCTSAPPQLPQNYGSLRRKGIVGNRKIPDDALVDHNDFRYCTVSSVRSESAPPSENLIRASFTNQRRLQLKTDTFKSSPETVTYDFRQLTVSPVQSMSVPPNKVDDRETLRNLTVSPIRSVSVMPNTSPLQEEECFSNYSQLPNRSASVPPNYFQAYNPQNFPLSRATTTSDSSDAGFIYATSTDHPPTPSSSQHGSDDNFVYGKMTVCPDGIVSISPISQSKEKFSPSNSKTPPSSDSVAQGNQGEVSDSVVFGYKHPYLPERKLSVPYGSHDSVTNSDADSQSVVSFSSLSDSATESLCKHPMKTEKISQNEGGRTYSESSKQDLSMDQRNSCNKENIVNTGHVLSHGVVQSEDMDEGPNQMQHPETSRRNSHDARTNESHANFPKDINKHKFMKKMSSHVHQGISIEPSDSDFQTTSESEPQESRHNPDIPLKKSSEIHEDEQNENTSVVFTDTQESRSTICLQEETVPKPETVIEAGSSGSESNLSGIFGHQFTQNYAPIDPNQFSLQKFRDCNRSELYSPEVSQTYTKKISAVDFYRQSKPNKNSSSAKSLDSCFALQSSKVQDKMSDDEDEAEEECRRPQIPKNLPEEKTKTDQLFRNRNHVLSPLTIKQLKNSPLKLGRSLSISSGDKSRLSRLRDKLSPLRIQNLVHSPFKFGRNIDLFDRKRWRSANDIVDVKETNIQKDACLLVKAKLFDNELPPSLKTSSKSVESAGSSLDKDSNLAKYIQGEETESDSSERSSLGTLIDCDWALDVLDQLTRISDNHGSSFSDDSFRFTKYASWTNLTDLPNQDLSDKKDEPNKTSNFMTDVKTNGIGQREAADGGESSVVDDKINVSRNHSAGNEPKKESAVPDEILESGELLFKSLSNENTNTNCDLKHDCDFEEKVEEHTEEKISEDSSLVATEWDDKTKVITCKEVEKEFSPSRDLQTDLFPENKIQNNFMASQDALNLNVKQDFCGDNSPTESGSDLCEKSNPIENSSNTSMTGSQMPQKLQTKTYNAGKNLDREHARYENHKSVGKSNEMAKPTAENGQINVISKTAYQDGKMSVVREDHIFFKENYEPESIHDMACWENWENSEEQDNNNRESFDYFRNNLIQETLSHEMFYPWESSMVDSDESNDSSREEGAMNVAFLSDEKKGYRKTHSHWPRSRYPRTVSQAVDPLLMPTIHEHKMMTEQFIYDDEATDNYHFDDPQLTIPAFELYDDRRSKVNKYSSYFREKSLHSRNDVHPTVYTTRDSLRVQNSMDSRNSVFEDLFPKSETNFSDSHAFL